MVYNEIDHLKKRWKYRLKVVGRARIFYRIEDDGGINRFLEDVEDDFEREDEE